MNTLKWGSLEDICAEIGYTATTALVVWFGGDQVWVPRALDQSHALSKCLGLPAALRLAKNFPGKRIFVPDGHQMSIDRRDKTIAVMVWSGVKIRNVAVIMAMSDKQIYNVVERVEALGIKPMLCKRAGLEISGKKRKTDSRWEISVKNSSESPLPIPGVPDCERVCDPLKPMFAIGDVVEAHGKRFVITSLPRMNMLSASGEPAYRYRKVDGLRYGVEYSLAQRDMEDGRAARVPRAV